MSTIKYSRQREAIREYLTHTASHPTAEEVYQVLRVEYPNLSLGTVYRNLNLFVEQGEADKFVTEGGRERYDGNTRMHYHFFCEECGRVFDVPMELMPQLNTLAQVAFVGEVSSHSLMFYGRCGDCKKTINGIDKK